MIDDRSQSGFEVAVAEAFAFLVEDGFQITRSEPTVVWLERRDVRLVVFHGRISFELGGEIGFVPQPKPTRGMQPLEEKFTIWEIAQAVDAPDVNERTFLQATEPERIRNGVRKLATFVERYAAPALAGDREFFSRVREWQVRASDRFVAEGALRYASLKADEAWKHREYGRFVELLMPHQQLLTPVQQKKLTLARSRISVDDSSTTRWIE